MKLSCVDAEALSKILKGHKMKLLHIRCGADGDAVAPLVEALQENTPEELCLDFTTPIGYEDAKKMQAIEQTSGAKCEFRYRVAKLYKSDQVFRSRVFQEPAAEEDPAVEEPVTEQQQQQAEEPVAGTSGSGTSSPVNTGLYNGIASCRFGLTVPALLCAHSTYKAYRHGNLACTQERIWRYGKSVAIGGACGAILHGGISLMPERISGGIHDYTVDLLAGSPDTTHWAKTMLLGAALGIAYIEIKGRLKQQQQSSGWSERVFGSYALVKVCLLASVVLLAAAAAIAPGFSKKFQGQREEDEKGEEEVGHGALPLGA